MGVKRQLLGDLSKESWPTSGTSLEAVVASDTPHHRRESGRQQEKRLSKKSMVQQHQGMDWYESYKGQASGTRQR